MNLEDITQSIKDTIWLFFMIKRAEIFTFVSVLKDLCFSFYLLFKPIIAYLRGEFSSALSYR